MQKKLIFTALSGAVLVAGMGAASASAADAPSLVLSRMANRAVEQSAEGVQDSGAGQSAGTQQAGIPQPSANLPRGALPKVKKLNAFFGAGTVLGSVALGSVLAANEGRPASP